MPVTAQIARTVQSPVISCSGFGLYRRHIQPDLLQNFVYDLGQDFLLHLSQLL